MGERARGCYTQLDPSSLAEPVPPRIKIMKVTGKYDKNDCFLIKKNGNNNEM